MAYSTKSDYEAIYGNGSITESEFTRFSWEASRVMDVQTTGIDDVRKLSVAMPEDEYSLTCVKNCCCKLVNVLKQIEEAESSGAGFLTRADGLLQPRVVASVSSGSESMSFSNGATAISKAVADENERDKLLAKICHRYLSGVEDKNGVRLLFMGVYPCTLTQ